MRCLTTSAQGGEQLKNCCTGSRSLYMTTICVRSSCRPSRSSLLPGQSQPNLRQHCWSTAFTRPHSGLQLSQRQPVSPDEVRRLLTSMPCKSSPLDVLPCSLLKSSCDVFAPVIPKLANQPRHSRHTTSGYSFCRCWKKNAGLDKSLPLNYRPISNLSTISKILERLVLARLPPHLFSSVNFSEFQSAYRKRHSTETALLEVLDDVCTAADDRQATVVIGLDLSAAFDTVCHEFVTSSKRMVCSIISPPMTRSSILPCASTTQLPACWYLPAALTTSDYGISRMAYSLTPTSPRS